MEFVLEELRAIVEEYWCRMPYHGKGQGAEAFDELLGKKALRELLDQVRIPVPMYGVIWGEEIVPYEHTSRPMRVEGRPLVDVLDPAKIKAYMREGASLLLSGVDEYWAPVSRACRFLGLQSGLDITAFAVVTPPGNPGVPPHVDKSDQLILQCEGAKEWSVWDAMPQFAPEGLDEEVELGETILGANLGMGDLLYLPRGAPHQARTGEELSIHITLILQSPSIGNFCSEAFREVALEESRALVSVHPFWFEQSGQDEERVRLAWDDLSRRGRERALKKLAEWQERHRPDRA